MKSLNDCYTLSNGVKIPCIGFGAWSEKDDEAFVSKMVTVIETGYRLIDTAQGYGNEKGIGAAIKKSGIPREQFFLTSKVGNGNYGYEKTVASLEESFAKLDMDYVDLYIIHWPDPFSIRDNSHEATIGTWKALEEWYEAKRIRAIGLSNYYERHIEPIMKAANVAPMLNQVRLCPGDTKDELTDYCRSKNILMQAYSPLGAGRIAEVPEIKALAEKYGKTIAQICIRWSLQMGFNPIPRTYNTERMKENIDVFDFELSESDVRLMADLKGCVGYSSNPDKTE